VASSPALSTAPALGADPVLEAVREFYERNHEGIERARHARRYFYGYLTRILQQRVAPGQRVLEIGCGSGHLMAALQPAAGVGIDLSGRAIARAQRLHGADGRLRFVEGDGSDPEVLASAGGPFDSILLVNVVTELSDVQAMFESLAPLCHRHTRLFIYSYSRLWQPVLRMAEALGLKHHPPPDSWLPPEEIRNMLRLADYEVVRQDSHLVFPAYVPLLSELLNRYLGRLPGFQQLSLMYGIIARPAAHRFAQPAAPSASVIVPCRNESGHIRPLVRRLPDLGPGSEFIFVEGNSTDDTEQVIRDVIAENPQLPLRLFKQTGKGKGDAVKLGFAHAQGDVVLILDSDMGVAPEDVPKFVRALAQGKGEMINGSRMVYPIEGQAMRFLNMIANKMFAILFSRNFVERM